MRHHQSLPAISAPPRRPGHARRHPHRPPTRTIKINPPIIRIRSRRRRRSGQRLDRRRKLIRLMVIEHRVPNANLIPIHQQMRLFKHLRIHHRANARSRIKQSPVPIPLPDPGMKPRNRRIGNHNRIKRPPPNKHALPQNQAMKLFRIVDDQYRHWDFGRIVGVLANVGNWEQ